jgi:hypothetical protein
VSATQLPLLHEEEEGVTTLLQDSSDVRARNPRGIPLLLLLLMR